MSEPKSDSPGLREGQRVFIRYKDKTRADGVRGVILRVGSDSAQVRSDKSGEPIAVRFDNIAEVDQLDTGLTTYRASRPLQPTIVRMYRGKQEDAKTAFQSDAAALALQGYRPTAQSWAAGQWGCGAFLVALLLAVVLIGIPIFIYLVIVKPDGTLTVTYVLHEEPRATEGAPVESTSAPPIEAPAMKVCPRCAEDIRAAAVVCRYCGHEFADAETDDS